MDTTTTTLAAEMSGHILGTLGASGAAFAATVLLVLGCKGRKKIKFDQMQAAACGLVAGTLYAAAVGVWSAPVSLSKGITSSIQHGVGGNVGVGAVALVLTLVIYGASLKPRTAGLVGIVAASAYAAAGGIWGVVSTALSACLNQVMGV
jgi:hypothetical protein